LPTPCPEAFGWKQRGLIEIKTKQQSFEVIRINLHGSFEWIRNNAVPSLTLNCGICSNGITSSSSLVSNFSNFHPRSSESFYHGTKMVAYTYIPSLQSNFLIPSASIQSLLFLFFCILSVLLGFPKGARFLSFLNHSSYSFVISHVLNSRYAAQSFRNLCPLRCSGFPVFVFKHLCYLKALL
jgi:hypothetical protein